MNKFDGIQSIGICRTCATESRGLKNVFVPENDTTIAEMIFLCTQIPIFEIDDRPTGICRSCIAKLKTSFEFYHLVRSSEEKFLTQCSTVDLFDVKEEPSAVDDVKVEVNEVEEPDEILQPIIFVEPIPKPDQIFNDDIPSKRKRGRPPVMRPVIETPPNLLKKPKSFECYQCRMKFKSLCKVRMHLREHDPRHLCRICIKRFTKQEFETHLCSGDNMNCDQCSESFTSTMDLVNHLENDHRLPLKYKCYKCARKYQMKLLLDIHKETHTDDEKKFICDICGIRVRTRFLIKEHMEVMHTDKRVSLCSICGKSFRKMTTLRAHAKRHELTRSIMCSLCPKSFIDKYALKKHLEVHEDATYVCNVCGAVMRSKGSLNEHMRRHKRRKTYTCEVCSKEIKTSLYNLKLHMLTHTGEKPFKCKFCDRAYGQNADLNKHLRTHVGENTYPCTMCPKAFRLQVELRRHYAEHYLANKTAGNQSKNSKSLEEI